MRYFKDVEGNVYAYSDEQIQKTLELTKIEAAMPSSKQRLYSVPAIVFKMREDIQNFHEMSDDEVGAYINPPKTHEQLVTEAEEQKVHLLAQAASKISPFQDTVDLGIATESEISQLKEWKKYRVLVNRVDTSTAPDIDWPEIPE